MSNEESANQLTKEEADALSIYSETFKNPKPIYAMTAPPNNASAQYVFIKQYIQEFESSLDLQHEVAISFTNFGHSTLMRVTEILCYDPVLIIFKGYINDELSISTLIQHISQLNFLLTSVKTTEKRPKRKIGFVTE